MNHSVDKSVPRQPRVCDLAAAVARMGSNVKLVQEILELFREDAPLYQSQLHEAIARKDAAEVEKAAHSLKGMLCTFGAEAAMQIAQRLERSGSQGDLSTVPAQICELDAEIARFLETATSELAKL